MHLKLNEGKGNFLNPFLKMKGNFLNPYVVFLKDRENALTSAGCVAMQACS